MKPELSYEANESRSSAYELPRERLLAHINELSPQQRLIAEFLLDNLQEVPFLSVPQVAERTGASEATVVRLCQRIGFSGYSDLKMALVETLREELQPASHGHEAPAADAQTYPLAAVAALEGHNIQRTLDMVDRGVFETVATLLFRADHIFTFGLGISAHLADLASYLFTEHGLRSTCFATRFTSPREQLVALRASDLVLVFSLPPYSRQSLDVLKEARERGARTVAITDRPSAPAAALADQSLPVSSHGMMFTNATAAVNVLLNALLVQIAFRHRGDTVEALSRINRILRDQNDLVGEDG